jgi:hypothetical protein
MDLTVQLNGQFAAVSKKVFCFVERVFVMIPLLVVSDEMLPLSFKKCIKSTVCRKARIAPYVVMPSTL